MARTKWLDRTQPQTLYMATILMYFSAALNLLFGFTSFGIRIFGVAHILPFVGILLIAGQVGGGWGIANEKKWGYYVALVAAVLLLAETLSWFSSSSAINLIFEIALVALLLHPQSREYRRIWFR
jgi:hypothetical protein